LSGKQGKRNERYCIELQLTQIHIELRGSAPIGIHGMMAHWNNGFWGIDGMVYWENQVDKA
jgi:hypothetical protein